MGKGRSTTRRRGIGHEVARALGRGRNRACLNTWWQTVSVQVQIESARVLDNIDAIATVDRRSIGLSGLSGLSGSLGTRKRLPTANGLPC